MIINQDAERIIKERQRRLDELSRPEIWDRYTRHLECGELKEFKQSCIDDEIIIEALKPYATEKPLTYFDLIKAMSVEEMAEHIYLHDDRLIDVVCKTMHKHCPFGDNVTPQNCVSCVKKWLESEVQGE